MTVRETRVAIDRLFCAGCDYESMAAIAEHAASYADILYDEELDDELFDTAA